MRISKTSLETQQGLSVLELTKNTKSEQKLGNFFKKRIKNQVVIKSK